MTIQADIASTQTLKTTQALAIQVLRTCATRSNREAISAPARAGGASPLKPNGEAAWGGGGGWGGGISAPARAAPLKRKALSPRRVAPPLFPPPRGAAPLEADIATAMPLPSPSIPAPARAAPSKPTFRFRMGFASGFPPPRGGGPVEALRASQQRPVTLHFRPRAGAAPLKPSPSGKCQTEPLKIISAPARGGPVEATWAVRIAPQQVTRFPPPRGGGPVEASWLAGVSRAAVDFRPPRGAAPLKPDPRTGSGHGLGQISAPARGRPR